MVSGMDYEQLYNSYYMQVYSFVMTLAKSRDLAEELTQQAFYKAMVTQADFAGGSGELTWLCAIAKNTYIDECRKQARFQNADRELTDDRNMEKLLEDEGATLQIHRILHKLEEPYKEVFQLRVFGELSFRKIGQIFDKTEAWARVTYHRARLKIKERMEEHGTEI